MKINGTLKNTSSSSSNAFLAYFKLLEILSRPLSILLPKDLKNIPKIAYTC